jgi:hypothetical protein
VIEAPWSSARRPARDSSAGGHHEHRNHLVRGVVPSAPRPDPRRRSSRRRSAGRGGGDRHRAAGRVGHPYPPRAAGWTPSGPAPRIAINANPTVTIAAARTPSQIPVKNRDRDRRHGQRDRDRA